jgi:hypothetical protein
VSRRARFVVVVLAVTVATGVIAAWVTDARRGAVGASGSVEDVVASTGQDLSAVAVRPVVDRTADRWVKFAPKSRVVLGLVLLAAAATATGELRARRRRCREFRVPTSVRRHSLISRAPPAFAG